jgi:homocysteine S-methyltransferase
MELTFDRGPLLVDGAMGTMLYTQGISFDRCLDDVNRSDPELVLRVHEAYLAAGADIIETNTFGANRLKLAEHGLDDQVAEINLAGVRLARQAVEESGREAFVAGSVGPLPQRIAPIGRLSASEVQEIFAEQIAALAKGGVDLIILETFSDLREMKAAIRAARLVCELPVVAQMTYAEDGRTPLGFSPSEVADQLREMGVDAVGLNCSVGPARALEVLRILAEKLPDTALSVQPNAGWPERIGGRVIYAATPDYFGEYACQFVAAGATLVGGCCGTTPQHTAAMRAALDGTPRPHEVTPIAVLPHPRRELRIRPAEGPTELARKLAAGRFVVSVEVDPPRGFEPAHILAAARELREAGVDVINVADSPMARMRMSPWAVCHLIQQDVGVETVLHFPTRGRNLLRVQGDLLAAHALGVRNVFVVMGDPPAIGDYPEAAANYDVVPSGLVGIIKNQLNRGVDQAGSPIGQPTGFLVGVALNLAARDLQREARILHRKIEAGADFALTQPIYDLTAVGRFRAAYEERYGPLSLPVFAGILPLQNLAHTEFLHNEVPGILIPESIRERMRKAGARGPEVGIKLARELLVALAGSVQGVYLMPAFGRYEQVGEITEVLDRR